MPISEQDGYGTVYLPIKALATRSVGNIVFAGAEHKSKPPVLVYFYDGSLDQDKMERIEKQMFGDDDLAMASKFFRCLRIDVDQMESKENKERYGKRLPALYVLDPEGKILATKTGALRSRNVEALLKKAYKVVFDENLATRVKAFGDYLDRLDKAHDGVAKVNAELDLLNERLAKRETPRLVKQIKEAEEELSKAREELSKVEAEKAKHLAPPAPKGDETVKKD